MSSIQQAREILEFLLPFLHTAGKYSAMIQERVGTHQAKEGATVFHHALSDADLSIQAFLEVALLSKFPQVSFFSEEQEQSLNAKYFEAEAPLEILVDPIDGTRPYIDRSQHYQIIVTLHDEEGIIGALCHMPRRERCYCALRGQGAFLIATDAAPRNLRWDPFRISYSNGPVLVFDSPDLMARIAPHMEVADIVESYATAPDKHKFTDILEGTSAASVYGWCQAIDGGAIGFIVQEAGGVMSHFRGAPVGSYRGSPKRVLEEVVVAANRDIHQRLLEILGNP